MRKIINHHQKAQVAFAALKGDKTMAELSSEYQVHPTKIDQWKEVLRRGAPQLFAEAAQGTKEHARIEQLQKIIGQRQEEIDWLKKKLPTPHS
jgi:transposase-like protein